MSDNPDIKIMERALEGEYLMNIQTRATYEGKYCRAEILDALKDFTLDHPIYFKSFASQYISLETAREIIRELQAAIDSLPSGNPSAGL